MSVATAAPETLTSAAPFSRAIGFLVHYTREDEATILANALRFGLDLLYRQAVEQAYVDEQMPQAEALAALGSTRVAELDYAKQALLVDIERGLTS